jgi:peptidoglycan/xylan/chitin deacetylase (PgdA/CDA1 family)
VLTNQTRAAVTTGALVTLLVGLAAACGGTGGAAGDERAPEEIVTTTLPETTTTTGLWYTPSTTIADVVPSPPPVVPWIDTADPVVFITIDDGDVRDPAVIDFIREHNFPVSLFLVEGPADRGADYFRQMQDAGATIHTHTINHVNLRNQSAEGQRREICEPVDEFEQLFGRAPTLFRPPYGNYNDTTITTAGSCGQVAIVLWAGNMWEGNLEMQHDLRAGDIILMHFRDDLLQNLQVLVPMLEAQGLEVGRLEDYIAGAG